MSQLMNCEGFEHVASLGVLSFTHAFHLHTVFRKSVPCSNCRATRTFWKIQGRAVPEYYSQGVSGQMFSTNCSQILYTHLVVSPILEGRKTKYVRLSMNYGCVVDSGRVKNRQVVQTLGTWVPSC